jgi:hypothetical protein
MASVRWSTSKSARRNSKRCFQPMKVWLVAGTLILVLLQGCSTPEVETIPRQFPDEEIEHKLRSILPVGWSLVTQDNTFTLSRNEKVWVYVNVAWNVVDLRRSFEEAVKKYGREERYEIKLRFVPRLTDCEFEQLRLARELYEKILTEGTQSKSEWAYAIQEFYKHKVPVYFTDKYSVFAEESNDYPVQIYPESVLPECKQVLASLDSLFQRYKKSAGRVTDF